MNMANMTPLSPLVVSDTEELDRFRASDYTPIRVVVNQQGNALSPFKANAQHQILSRFVFIRNDGWTLGTPVAFLKAAYSLWPKEWAYVFDYVSREFYSIEVFRLAYGLDQQQFDFGKANRIAEEGV